MRRHRVFPAVTMLRVISRLVPASRRAAWLTEWRAEVEHAWSEGRTAGGAGRVLLRLRLTLRAMAAVPDAFWLRRRARGGSTWTRTLRDAVRSLRRRPTFTLAVVGTLALGLGASTAIFSVLDGLLWRPLPFRHPEQLVSLYGATADFGMDRDVVNAWKRRTDLFQDVRAYSLRNVVATGTRETQSGLAALAEPGFLKMLGIRPTLGRPLGSADAKPGSDHVVLLSDELWREGFAADPAVLGRSVDLNGESYTVIGVLPPALHRLPVAVVQMVLPLDEGVGYVGGAGGDVLAIGRLRPGLSVDSARARVTRVAARLDRERPRRGGWDVLLRALSHNLDAGTVHGLHALGGAVLCLLLIACANAAGLLILRGVARRDEIALRLALGSSRIAVAAQVLAESLLMALAAGVVGMLLAWLGAHALLALVPPHLVKFSYTPVSVDCRVFLFALGLTVLTGVAFGTLPALRSAATPVTRSGVSTTPTRHDVRLRAAVQALQLALVVVLLWGAGVFARSFTDIMSVPMGYDPAHVLHLRLLSLDPERKDSAAEVQRARLLDERLRGLPGVASVARSGMKIFAFGDTVQVEGGAPRRLEEFTNLRVDTAYFGAMGIHLSAGRGFNAADLIGGPSSVVLSRSMARALWPDGDALGKRFRKGTGPWLTVVGVSGDVKLDGPRDPHGSLRYFLPERDEKLASGDLWIRTRGAPAGMAAPVRSLARKIAPDQPVEVLETGAQIIANDVRDARLLLDVVAVFALVAIVLALVGVYSLVSFTVAQRKREIGIRVALGARASNLVGAVLRQGLFLAGLGVVLGLLGAAVLSRFVRVLVFGLSPVDPASLGAAAVVLLVCSGLALVGPARRAASVDPSEALRAE